MSYTHTGKIPVVFKSDPIDPDSTDWVFFIYDLWLREGEQIVAHEALIEGGTIVTDSTFIGEMPDDEGTTYEQVYGVELSVTEGSTSVTVTHRVTTVTSGIVDLGRTKIDLSVIIPVRHL